MKAKVSFNNFTVIADNGDTVRVDNLSAEYEYSAEELKIISDGIEKLIPSLIKEMKGFRLAMKA